MAAPYNPPVKNQNFLVRVALRSASDVTRFQTNPTIAAGDFKVDLDGAGLTNLGTLPSVSPAGSKLVLITLSAAEMNGDVVTVVCSDQTATAEWSDYAFSIPTASA